MNPSMFIFNGRRAAVVGGLRVAVRYGFFYKGEGAHWCSSTCQRGGRAQQQARSIPRRRLSEREKEKEGGQEEDTVVTTGTHLRAGP